MQPQWTAMFISETSAFGAEQWIDEIKLHTGIGDDVQARRVLDAVLESLGDVLLPEEARLLEESLPEPLAHAVHVGAEQGFAPGDFDDLIDGVEWREKTSQATACEHATAVLEILARSLDPVTRDTVASHLPASIARRLEARSTAGTSAGRRPQHDPRELSHTLATGRPGSLHPLSEARPDSAHSQSVARSDNPHADTKVSTTHGLTQERFRETLAEGRPGPSRPISGG